MPVTVEEALARYPGSVTFRYGDGPDLNRDIIALVRAGVKKVSCDAWEAFGARGRAFEPAGGVGDGAFGTVGAERVEGALDRDTRHPRAGIEHDLGGLEQPGLGQGKAYTCGT